MHPSEKYINDVLSGKQIACKWVRLACERQQKDLARQRTKDFPYYFDPEAGSKAVKFFSFLQHYKGHLAGQPFTLEPFQQFIIHTVFGWKKLNGYRRFKECYVEIAKKNGKTLMAGGIGNYLMVADGEQGAEVYSIATTRDQARICFDDSAKMVATSSALKNRVQVYAHSMFIQQSSAKFKPLSSDADSFEGKNPHCAINDEFHIQDNWELYNNTKSAMVARKQPLLFTITTAGYNKQSPCYQLRTTVTEVLQDIKQNEALFGVIFTLDEEDNWQDETNWIKSNPCLGAALDIEALREEFIGAVNTPSMQVGFLTKNLNIWTDASEVWITDDAWKKCRADIDWPSLAGQRCFGGLDLSSKLDITCLILLFKQGNKHLLKPYFWIPEDTARERSKRDGVDYLTWIKQGYIEVTPGNVVDYAFIKAKILELSAVYQINSIAFDPWNATQLSIELTEEGATVSEFRQGFGSMSAPTKEFEKMVLAREIEHDGNPVLRWMLSNVEIKRDPAGNIKVDKGKSKEKVDGIVAAIMALGEQMSNPDPGSSIYEQIDIFGNPIVK
jgi:phage terminase large subunit-like protein